MEGRYLEGVTLEEAMTHRTLAALLLSPALLAACAGLDKPDGEGTEIGDEGSGWMCIESTSTVTDAGQPIDALGASPEGLIADSTGTFTSAEAHLSLRAGTDDMTWFDLEPQEFEDDYRPSDTPPECVDFLYVTAEVALELEALLLDSAIAGISYADDGSASFRAGARVYQGPVREDPDDDEGGGDEGDSGDYWADNSSVSTTRTPSSFVIEEMFSVELVLDGTQTEDGWALELWWLAESYPEGPDANVSSYEETLWTGTVTLGE